METNATNRPVNRSRNQTANKGGRPPLAPGLKSIEKIMWHARPIDVAGIDLIGEKRRLDRPTVIRLAIAHLVDFEGLREKVEEKANLLVERAVSSAG